MLDWHAAWRTWVRNAIQFEARKNGNAKVVDFQVRSEWERKERYRLQEERQRKLERGENPYA
jgi:hypothetical protein